MLYEYEWGTGILLSLGTVRLVRRVTHTFELRRGARILRARAAPM